MYKTIRKTLHQIRGSYKATYNNQMTSLLSNTMRDKAGKEAKISEKDPNKILSIKLFGTKK